LTGRGQGIVLNQGDPFYGGTAVVQSCICETCDSNKDSLLFYSVQKDNVLECFSVFPECLIIDCPTLQEPNRIVIKGIGTVIKKEQYQQDVTSIGSFVLTVWDVGAGSGGDRFEMIISVEGNPGLNHNSGIVNANNSNLIIGTCPDT